MKLIELYFWNSLYWALYLPLSLLILLLTGQGDVLGIIIVGSLMTAILSLILVFQEGVLLDDFEPALVMLADEPLQETTDVEISNLEKTVKQNSVQQSAEPSPKEKIESKPKRKYVRKQLVESVSAENKPLEVQPNEKEEQKTKPVESVGMEPEPKMRTDVDLEQLDAPDDDNVS